MSNKKHWTCNTEWRFMMIVQRTMTLNEEELASQQQAKKGNPKNPRNQAKNSRDPTGWSPVGSGTRANKEVQRTTSQLYRQNQHNIEQRREGPSADEQPESQGLQHRAKTSDGSAKKMTLSKEGAAGQQWAKTNNSVWRSTIVGEELTLCKEPSCVDWWVDFPFYLIKELFKSDLFRPRYAHLERRQQIE